MKFVEKHFTRHHLLRAPHRWFFAFLTSPVHFLELHYKRRYHLTYAHARKLFLFDVGLLVSAIALIGVTIFLFQYNPTVVNHVKLSITPTEHTSTFPVEKIRSGEHITYTILFENQSEQTLIDPSIMLELPHTFVLDEMVTGTGFSPHTKTFDLAPIRPSEGGSVTFAGLLFGEPGTELHIGATLLYHQPKSNELESKAVRIITILRESVVTATIETPKKILNTATFPLTLVLTNDYHHLIEHISVPLDLPEGFSFVSTSASIGRVHETRLWNIDVLKPDQTISMTGIVQANLNTNVEPKTISLTPIVTTENISVKQHPALSVLNIVSPSIEGSAVWKEQSGSVLPGDTIPFIITLENTGDMVLADVSVSIPYPTTIVDSERMRELTPGTHTKGSISISSKHNASLVQINPGDTAKLSIDVPIEYIPSGDTNLSFELTPTILAHIKDIPEATFQQQLKPSTPISIGTQVILSSALRYYTDEGDQLGRGPLPPIVGKQTKYWALINVQNTTSKLQNLALQIYLGDDVVWTGRSSVSHGKGVVYNKPTHSISWTTPSIGTQQTVGVYVELGITPEASTSNTSPVVVKDIVFTAKDSFINTLLTRTSDTLDTTIPEDAIGKALGVTVR